MHKTKPSFLEIIKRDLGEASAAGDQFGGGSGADGSGLPTGAARNFMFATGIEVFQSHHRQRADAPAINWKNVVICSIGRKICRW